jgi:antitoxin (DNA-binding transcriptional repressor) of toxin-antitoxin stability system
MKQVTIRELKKKLDQCLGLVKRGEVVEVLERSVPIARLEPIARDRTGSSVLLDQLVREGIVTPPKRRATRTWLKNRPVRCKGDAVQVLIQQRDCR